MSDLDGNQEGVVFLENWFSSDGSPSGSGWELEDNAIIGLAQTATNSDRFKALFYCGDAGYPSKSEADLALVSILAFYTQDPAQLDRLFRRSALMRSKWEREDYRRRTVSKAINSLTETYKSPWGMPPLDRPSEAVKSRESGRSGQVRAGRRHSIRDAQQEDGKISLQEFASEKPPPPGEFLVEGLVPREHMTLLYGDGGVAKSTLAMSLGLAVSRGSDTWLGCELSEGCSVLYLDFELDCTTQHRRAIALSEGDGEPIHECFKYMSTLEADSSVEAFSAALAACKQHHIGLMIVDSLGPALEGNPSDTRDYIEFYNRMIRPFRELGITVVAIDHQSKLQFGENYQGKGAFGSVYKKNLARSVIQLETSNREDGLLELRLRQHKNNFGALRDPFAVKIEFHHDRITVWGTPLDDLEMCEELTVPEPHRVLYALRTGILTIPEISDYTAIQQKKVRMIVGRWCEKGVVLHTGEFKCKHELFELHNEGR